MSAARTVTLAVALLLGSAGAGCRGADRPMAPDGPILFSIAAGDGQTGQAGRELAQPLVVLATDAAGRPLPGLTVVYVVTLGGGSLYAAGVLTNSAGVAQNFWSLGAAPGTPQAVEVRSVDPTTGQKQLHATFRATATP